MTSWLRLQCDGTRAETRFRLSAKRTSPFKSTGASVQSTTGSQCVRISGSNAGYTKFRGSVKSTGYPLHSPVSSSLPFLCVIVCHHISTGHYKKRSVFPSKLIRFFCPTVRKRSTYNCHVYKTEILSTQLLYGHVKHQVTFHNWLYIYTYIHCKYV
jgi:hypothetical protein